MEGFCFYCEVGGKVAQHLEKRQGSEVVGRGKVCNGGQEGRD